MVALALLVRGKLACREKAEFLKELKNFSETVAKMEQDPENTIIMELTSSIINLIVINDCTIQSRGFWKKALEFLKKAEYYLDKDKSLTKKYLESLSKAIETVVKYEIWWRNKAVTVLVLSALVAPIIPTISLATYVPLIAISISLIDVALGVLALLGGGVGVLFRRPIIGGIYLALSLIGLYEKPLNVELKEPKPEPEISEEEVRNLFRKLYGKEGDEIFEFELYHLIVNGYTRKEALIELWKRLTGNDLSSSSRRIEGEHVSAGEGKGIKDHREKGHNA